ncbi:7708_t:CDS:2, partial [Funneliformis geosporum]
KENQTGRETQAKWKWFERINTLFGTFKNHNPSFLLDGFSNDIDLFNKFEKKEVKEIIEIKEESLMKVKIEKEIREAEIQSRMEFQLRIKKLDIKMLQLKTSSE